jgi:N-formylglutamate deformylase
VRRYGDPASHRHSVQVEVNRKLYMDEETLEPHAGFGRLRGHLRQLVERLIATDPRDLR